MEEETEGKYASIFFQALQIQCNYYEIEQPRFLVGCTHEFFVTYTHWQIYQHVMTFILFMSQT